MIRRALRGCVLPFVLCSVAACSGGSSPTVPSVPSLVTLNVVDGLTGQPVPSGSLVYKGGAVPISGGTVQLPDLAAGDRVTVTGAAGYRERNTLFCGDTTVKLWVNRPGDVDEALTQAVAYEPASGRMLRPESVFLVPSPDLQADGQAMATLRDAASRVENAIQSKTPIAVVTSSPGRQATFVMSIDPGISSMGLTTFAFSGGTVTGGTVRYKSLSAARSLPLTMHEITRTLGINGNSPYPGVMNVTVSPTSEYTPAEQRLLLLRYTRPTSALFQGDNDQNVPCGTR